MRTTIPSRKATSSAFACLPIESALVRPRRLSWRFCPSWTPTTCGDTLTILAGEDIDDDAFDALVARIEEAHEDLEIDAHRGDQPLYPIVMSVE